MRLIVEYDIPGAKKEEYVRELYRDQDWFGFVRNHAESDSWQVRGLELDSTEYVPGRRVGFNVAAAMEQDALKEEAQNKVMEMMKSERGVKDTDNVGPGDIRDDKFQSVQPEEYSVPKHLAEANKEMNEQNDPEVKKRHDEAQQRQEKSVGSSSEDWKDLGLDEQRQTDVHSNVQDMKADDKTDRTTTKATNKSEDKTQADLKAEQEKQEREAQKK